MNCPVCDDGKVIGIAGTDYPCPACVIPALLAALEETIQFVTKWANDNDSTIGHRAVARAEAAIAKAKGQSQ